jgi:HAD superfamily hydrolase (TIGR01549 family)
VTLTLLVDLDDTLLANNMESFLPAYLQALGRHLAAQARPDHLIPALLSATRQMVANQRPDRTLKQTFDEHFYPALGIDSAALQETIADFYANVFPALGEQTHPQPGALALMEYARDCNYRVAIATNPLFPRQAILHRLAWAGIQPEAYPIELISSYETFHFAKPNPAYYAEILGRLGWPNERLVMIGDDPELDILPARRLGLPAYWVTDGGRSAPPGPLAPSASGALTGVLPWIEKAPAETLQPAFTGTDSIQAILRSTPAVLSSLTAGLPQTIFTECPRPGEWCLAEILCHLRDVETEVNLPRLRKVLAENNPFLPGMVTDPWAEERVYRLQDGQTALEDFTRARLELLAALESLQPADWQRPARHAIFGPTQLLELASIIANHDRLHIQQCTATLKDTSQDPAQP